MVVISANQVGHSCDIVASCRKRLNFSCGRFSPEVPTMSKRIETGTVNFITVQGDELEFADCAIMYLNMTVSNEEECLSIFEDVHIRCHQQCSDS